MPDFVLKDSPAFLLQGQKEKSVLFSTLQRATGTPESANRSSRMKFFVTYSALLQAVVNQESSL